MARKSACERDLETVEREPRFMKVSLAARMLFILLMRLARDHGDGSSLHFGSRLGFKFGSLNAVASWLRIAETEFETELRNLAETGLLDITEDSISVCAELGAYDRRAAAARKNGKNGGRPRKNALAQGQGWMPLPLKGGLDGAPPRETQETEIVTHEETQLGSGEDVGTTTSISERESSSTGEPPWVSLGRELAAILHLDPAGRHNFRIVKSWLEAGASAQWLRDVFIEVMNRKNPPPVPSFSYLGKVISQRLGKISAQPMEPIFARAITAEQKARAQELDQIHNRWKNEGFVAPFPPKRAEWVFGEVSDRARWLLYRTKGPAVFRQVA